MRRAGLLVLVAFALAEKVAVADPNAAQCIAANERAIILRKQLHFLAARNEASTCASASCPSEIREECARRIAEIEAEQPTIVFQIQDDGGTDLSAADVKLDDQPARRVDGSALSLDPGAHEFVFTSHGMQTVRRSFVIREGEKDRRERIVMHAVVASPSTQAPVTVSSKRSPVFRAAGLGIAGAGLVGVGLGVFFGLRASSLWSSSQSECGDARPCNAADHARAVQDHDSASTAATISTVAFACGAGAIAIGAASFFLAPVVSTKSAGMNVGMRF